MGQPQERGTQLADGSCLDEKRWFLGVGAAQEPASSPGTCFKVYGLPVHGATFLWEAGGVVGLVGGRG